MTPRSDPLKFRRFKDITIRRRFQIVFAEFRHWKLAWLLRLEKLSLVRTGKFLAIDLALEFHERMQQRFRSRRTARNENINRNVTVNSFEYVVALFERPAGDRACAHGDDVFRLSHLVVEAHNLWRNRPARIAAARSSSCVPSCKGPAWKSPRLPAVATRGVVFRRSLRS